MVVGLTVRMPPAFTLASAATNIPREPAGVKSWRPNGERRALVKLREAIMDISVRYDDVVRDFEPSLYSNSL